MLSFSIFEIVNINGSIVCNNTRKSAKESIDYNYVNAVQYFVKIGNSVKKFIKYKQ
jgi:hypothetical protein